MKLDKLKHAYIVWDEISATNALSADNNQLQN